MDIICDIDGTVANLEHRRQWVQSKPKNWKAFYQNINLDKPIQPVIKIIQDLICCKNTIIFCTEREEIYREITISWLEKYVYYPFNGKYPYSFVKRLYMRPKNDYRDDAAIKFELLQKIRTDGFNPTIVFDDRKRVCDMWIANGLHLFDVSQGKGDF
jgi:hypothetical protein